MSSHRTLNPFAKIRTTREGDEIVTLAIVAPVKGRGEQRSVFKKTDDADRFADARRTIVRALWDAERGSDVWSSSSPVQHELLASTGLFVSPGEQPAPVEYVCELDDGVQGGGDGFEALAGPLSVNPTLALEPITARRLRASEAVAIVRETGSLPGHYWLTERERACLAGLAPGALVPATIDATIRDRLRHADILIDPREWEDRQRRRTRLLADAARSFEARGFAVIPGLAPVAMRGAARRYHRDLIAQGFTTYGDDEGNLLRHVRHNEAVATFWHPALIDVTSAVAGEPVRPSFSYLVHYLRGADLAPHLDREQCRFTLSWQVDFDPEPSGVAPWPIFFTMPNGTVEAAHLAVGDAVLFRGHTVSHYREPLTEGQSSTMLTFCFVRPDFTGDLD